MIRTQSMTMQSKRISIANRDITPIYNRGNICILGFSEVEYIETKNNVEFFSDKYTILIGGECKC